MIQGLMITPPVIGRIAIGKVVERNGKRLPEKDDEFTITTQVQSRGQWILHPLDEALRQAQHGSIKEGLQPSSGGDALEGDTASAPVSTSPQAAARPSSKRSLKDKMGVATDAKQTVDTNAVKPPTAATARRKLRSIPVRMLFDDPDLNLRAHYTLFDRTTARPICVGDGEGCKRVTGQGLESLPCPGPDACSFGNQACKPYGRLNLVIGDSDELGSFVFRTTGFNSIRTLTARLQYFAAVSGGHLAGMPLELKLRGKSTTQSHRAAIYYADLVVRSGMSLNEAIAHAKDVAGQRLAAGFDQAALDTAARLGFANGSFEDASDEAAEIVEEFYPADTAPQADPASESVGLTPAAQARGRDGTHSPSSQRP